MPLMAATPPATDPAVKELAAAMEALIAKVDALQEAVDALPAVVATRTVDELRVRLVE